MDSRSKAILVSLRGSEATQALHKQKVDSSVCENRANFIYDSVLSIAKSLLCFIRKKKTRDTARRKPMFLQKKVYPHPAPLNPKRKRSFFRNSDRFFFLQSRGEPRTSASSTRAEAGHYCPPYSRARAPRSGRESVAPCGAIEKMDSASAESVDRHALQSKARDDRKSNKSKQNTKDSRKNTQILKTLQNENTESVFDTNAAGGRKMDSTQNAQNLNNSQAAKPTPAPSPSDSKIEAQNLNESAKDSRKNTRNLKTPQAAGFADDFLKKPAAAAPCTAAAGFVGCQGGGEGIYLSGNEQAPAADSHKSAAKPTPKTQKAGFIGVVGRPNTGKSSLLNLLVGEHLALISHKANATRNTMRFIVPYTTKDRTACQMIFVDTPGPVSYTHLRAHET